MIPEKNVKELGSTGHRGVVAQVSARKYDPPREGGSAEKTSAEALFRAHAAFVAAFVVRLGVGQEVVDDVVQDVFLMVHRLGGYEVGAAKPTTWLAEIALRVVSTHKRSLRRRRVVADEDALDRAVAPQGSPLEIVVQRAALARVQAALDTIDVDRRAVFILFELMGESCDDIARGLQIPVGTVHSRLFAARRSFQKAHDRLELDCRPANANDGARGDAHDL